MSNLTKFFIKDQFIQSEPTFTISTLSYLSKIVGHLKYIETDCRTLPWIQDANWTYIRRLLDVLCSFSLSAEGATINLNIFRIKQRTGLTNSVLETLIITINILYLCNDNHQGDCMKMQKFTQQIFSHPKSKRCEICSTINAPKCCQWHSRGLSLNIFHRFFSVFIKGFESLTSIWVLVMLSIEVILFLRE